MAKKQTIRKLKWVGEAPILMEDGFSVGHWAWENKRLIALVGFCTLRIDPMNMPGLSRAYTWGMLPDGNVSRNEKDMITDVDALDAELILKYRGDMLVDVTDHPDPLSVHNEPIIVTQDKETGKFYRSR